MKDSQLQHFLKQFTIFNTLHDHEMEPIIDIANSKKYKAGNIVFMQHEPIMDVYFIQEGKMKIYKTDYEGKEQIVNILQKDDMFPHQGFFRKGNYPAHAEVLEDATLVNIPILSFENFLLTIRKSALKCSKCLEVSLLIYSSDWKRKCCTMSMSRSSCFSCGWPEKTGRKLARMCIV